MSIRVIVNGAKGRMGRLALEAIEHDDTLELVAGVDVHDDLAQALQDNAVDVVVDLTTAAHAYTNTRIIIEQGVHPVIGTSGLTTGNIDELTQLCKAQQLGGLIVPNFSLGAVLMMRYATEIVQYLPDVEIIELHHANKADAPSGTAMRTAHQLAEARQAKDKHDCKEVVSGACGADVAGIPIHSVRLPGLVAHQTVLFGGQGETLRIQHDTYDRSSFMPGVLLACKKVMTLDGLVVGLEQVL